MYDIVVLNSKTVHFADSIFSGWLLYKPSVYSNLSVPKEKIMGEKNSQKTHPHLQLIKPYILVSAVLIIGGASLCSLIMTVVAAMSPRPYLAPLPFSAFIMTLRMAYGLARQLISGT